MLVGQVGAAAAALDVKRVVWNTSSWIPDKPGDAFTYAGNTKGINALWRSGAPGTVFGSVLFMDNLLTNWARPFIVSEGRYVYPHNPELEANWISLDDVAKFMLASLERPDMEGAWLNIGGPELMRGPQVSKVLSDTLGKPIKYDPCTPAEFGRYLVEAAGDGMPAAMREDFAKGIEAFYEYNNTAPTKPFGRHGPCLRALPRTGGQAGKHGPMGAAPGLGRKEPPPGLWLRTSEIAAAGYCLAAVLYSAARLVASAAKMAGSSSSLALVRRSTHWWNTCPPRSLRPNSTSFISPLCSAWCWRLPVL